MSATSPPITALGRPGSAAQATATERPLLRVGAFAGLALFGALRWGSLMSPAPTGRLVGLVAIATAIVVIGPWLSERSRAGAVAVTVAAGLAMLLVCGLHWEWLRHARIAVAARAIGNGIDRLPSVLLPYHGTNPWVPMVYLLGAALLLFDAALMLAFAARPIAQRRASQSEGPVARDTPGAAGDLRRAVAALPLIALAAVPLTLIPAKFQYAEGAVLFALLAVLVWGERLPRRGAGTAAFVCGVACVVAMVAAPWLDAHTPWIQYQTLASNIGLESQETFDWSQTYGPLDWPRDGRTVLEVSTPRPDYWTAAALDSFDGRAWTRSEPPPVQPGPDGISAQSRAKFTFSVSVTVGAMNTPYIIGPGDLEPPTRTGVNTTGDGPGRWLADTPLGPGDTYTVRGYAPHPTAAQLQAAGTAYPQSIVPQYLQLTLPVNPRVPGTQPIVWSDPFGSPAPVLYQSDFGETQGYELLNASPYARAFALARRLRAAATTPYQYVLSVMHLLAHGFTYDEHPPVRPYPLESFLFTDKRGYCQQFSGAMAMLLRLGGVPARVAAGFTSGQYDANLHRYVVTDYDAHAWVEAFFPNYGWVRFDPTPASADPAQQHSALGAISPGGTSTEPQATKSATPHGLGVPGESAAQHAHGAGHGGSGPLLAIFGLLAGLGLAGLAFATRPVPHQTPEQMLAELERAFRRSGRELAPQLTLAELERRMVNDPGAVGYVQAITRARFGTGGARPSAAERRALRNALASGLGLSGRLRALWALPPRW